MAISEDLTLQRLKEILTNVKAMETEHIRLEEVIEEIRTQLINDSVSLGKKNEEVI
jgi:hypothetical protein